MVKKIVVSGCNGQLGIEISRILNEADVYVLGVDIQDNCNNEFVSEYQLLDITSESEVELFWKANSNVFGLVNNAGIGVFTESLDRSKADFMKVLEVNVWGTFNMIKGYVNNRNSQLNHRVVNIASLYGHISSDYRIYGSSGRNNSEVYSASKSGVLGLTKYCAIHYMPLGFQINSVSPGGVRRRQTLDFQNNYGEKQPSGRLAEANEIAEVVVWMILESPTYLNGEDILVDYGFSKS